MRPDTTPATASPRAVSGAPAPPTVAAWRRFKQRHPRLFWTLVVAAGLYLAGAVLPQNRSSVPSTTGAPEPALPSYESVYRKCEDSLVSVNVKPRQYVAAKKDIFDCLLVTPHRPPSADEAQRMKEWWEGVEIAAGRQSE